MSAMFALSAPLSFDVDVARLFARYRRQTVRNVSDSSHNSPLAEAFSRAQRGDQQAFALVYDLLAGKVFATIKRVLRDPAMSEEVTQEVFVEIWQQAARFDAERSSVTTWALTMARRRAVDRVRREQSQRNRIEALAGQRNDDNVEPDEAVVSGLDGEVVRSALATLPEDQRDVLVLSFIDGLAHADIADRLALPLGTVKGRVRGGLRKLRAEMGDRDG